LNPNLIYCSMTGYGQNGPRAHHTVYDHLIQANSGIMSMTGTPETAPVKVGTQVLDFTTGLMAAFAISSAIHQRTHTGRGQYIDVAMLDTAMMLIASHVTGYLLTSHQPQPKGNWHRYASSELYDTKDGKLMLGAANPGQHRRLMAALGLDHLAQESYEQREAQRDAETNAIAAKLMEKTAKEWEAYLQERHVPAAVLRTMADMLDDPHMQTRGVLHQHQTVPGLDKPLTVPVAAFKYAEGGPRVDTPPPRMGADTDDILEGLGYGEAEIAALREAGAV
ncbi:MAG: CaiB/BaiF CoA-transferase family protein, partial [Rhodospirillales bacterium]